MQKLTLTFSLVFLLLLNSTAQSNPEWFYVRPGNTGVAGEYHHTITGDRFGNIWTGGYNPFWSEGQLYAVIQITAPYYF